MKICTNELHMFIISFILIVIEYYILFAEEHYWIGLTDLKEGEYRWILDQTKATFLPWHSGYGSSGTKYNCVMFHRQKAQWADYPCEHKWRYICERGHCKLYNDIFYI